MINTPYKNTWIFDNYHRLAGAPVVESLLMDAAVDLFLGAEVQHQDFKAIVKHMEKLQDDIILSHPRCRRCEITLAENPIVPDHATLQIGNGRLSLMRVQRMLLFE